MPEFPFHTIAKKGRKSRNKKFKNPKNKKLGKGDRVLLQMRSGGEGKKQKLKKILQGGEEKRKIVK